MMALVPAVLLLVACSESEAPPTPVPTPPTAEGAAGEAAVEVTAGVIFATKLDPNASESEWALDVYAPRDPGPWPVVVFAHGASGNRRGYVELSEALAEEGAVVYMIDWPAMPDDMAVRNDGRGMREIFETVACAVRFARATAPEYGGDPDRVTLGGHSYGGMVAMWAALVGEDVDRVWEEFAAERGAPPRQVECVGGEASAQVQSVVGVAGA
jgi:acetyl esterase/lipase